MRLTQTTFLSFNTSNKDVTMFESKKYSCKQYFIIIPEIYSFVVVNRINLTPFLYRNWKRLHLLK